MDDPEQVFILEELVRYLQSDSSGVSPFNSMGQNWKDLCVQVQQGSAINKSSGETLDVINNWHQLMRFNSLIMSQKLSQPVSWLLSKKQAADVEYHINSDLDNLVKNTHQLIAHFDIPNTAAPIQILADFLRRQLIFSISLDAPG